MKSNILTLIIGILIGAIITTAVFLILKENQGDQGNRMNIEEMPFMDGSFPNGENDFLMPEENLNQNEQDLKKAEE